MSFILIIATIFCAFFAVMFALICRKLSVDASLPAEDDWLQYLPPVRYSPMARLLDDDEYRRLSSHPAITRRMRRQIRARRLGLFRDYLRCLCIDYSRVCKSVKLLMVHSAHDRPDLARLLVTSRAEFTARVAVAELRLTMHSLGIGGVDTSELVSALERMRLQLNSLLAAQPMPTSA